MQIRTATGDDAEGIAAIYNDAVANTTAIWNDAAIDAGEWARSIARRQDGGFPVLVSVDDADSVLGYATYGPWRHHDGFRHTVEHSVYVSANRRGGGIGSSLMVALIDRARRQGMHVMVAGIDAENSASIRLHERLGFERVGLLPQVGTKFGRWLDLAFLQLTLDDRDPPRR